MAVREEDLARPRPLPALQMGAGPAAFVPTTPPTTPYGHLQPLLPDSTDHERISEIDQQALRNLRSFQHPRENNSPDEDLSQPLFPSPSSAGSRESCPSLNSPGGLSYQSRFARRQSAPFAGRPAAPEPGMLLIVAEQLPRLLHPTRVDQELEFWWPLHPGGVVELRFGIMTRRGRFRAMRIRLSIGPGGQPASRRPEQHLMPGSMLPVPGLNEYHPGRRFSTGSAPVPLRHRRYVRGARFGFPAQLISTCPSIIKRSVTDLCRYAAGVGALRHHPLLAHGGLRISS